MPTKKTTKKSAAKSTALKSVAKTVTAKSTVSSKKLGVITEPMTKSQLMAHIAQEAELTKKQISVVFDSLGDIIARHLKKRAAGTFNLNGLMKLTVINKPATKKRKGINPFTGEPAEFAAKPARRLVKVRALKKLKDMTTV